jgi:hypothetical protein
MLELASAFRVRAALRGQQLRLYARPQFRRTRADKSRVEPELAEDGANFAERDRRRLKFEVNDVVIAIDFVAQARDRGQFMIELENFVQVAHTGGIDFDFEHGPNVEGQRRDANRVRRIARQNALG